LVNERLIEAGNGYSMISKKASEAPKQINADLHGLDGTDHQLDQNSMQQTEEYPLSRNMSSRNQVDTVIESSPKMGQSNKTKFL
jgi:hypothetical protein